MSRRLWKIQTSLKTRGLGSGVHRNGVRNRVRIDDVGSLLNFRMGFSFEKKSALAGQLRLGFLVGFGDPCSFRGSILNFRIGQRAPNDPPKEDPSTNGVRVTFLSFLALLPTKQLFCRQLSLRKNMCIFPFK